MQAPFKVSTLIYVFDPRDRVLLMERAQEPNLGCWSPPGGKLRMNLGESPYACACREAHEEIGMNLHPADLHLTGIVSEEGYSDGAHWLMFLFEACTRLDVLPPPMREGRFQFHAREDLHRLALPTTDRESIWPLFWAHRGGFFAAHCRCDPKSGDTWTLEESRPASA